VVAMRSKAGLEFRRVGNEGIILDPDTGVFFRLSPEATARWEATNGSEAEISDSFLVLGVSQGQAFLARASCRTPGTNVKKSACDLTTCTWTETSPSPPRGTCK
jgi:hypothetical protein